MRINKFVARATGLSRRAADQAITEGRVTIDGRLAVPGDDVVETTAVKLDGQNLVLPASSMTIILNKPVGYVSSRQGQGSRTIYDLLPPELHHLKPVGRLDKDSSGLLLLTDDGELADKLTHPRYAKTKVYQIELNKPLSATDRQRIETGVKLGDGLSKLALRQLSDARHWEVTMTEGRNRQIRRTFATCGYTVTKLHRTQFGPYTINELQSGSYKEIQ